MKFSIKDFFGKRDQTWVWSHLMKKSLMENFIFVQWNENFINNLLIYSNDSF